MDDLCINYEGTITICWQPCQPGPTPEPTPLEEKPSSPPAPAVVKK